MTSRVLREQSKVSLSREFGRLLYETETSQRQVADACGVPAQHVSQWCDPEAPKTPSVADIRQMPAPIAKGLLAWLAQPLSLDVVDAHEPSAVAGDYLGHLARMIKEGGDVTSELSSAMRDGQISPDEAKRVHLEACEAVAVYIELANRMKAILDSRGAEVVDLKRGAAG